MDSKEDIHNRLKDVLVELFGIDPAKITPEANLYQDLGIDSIDAIDLLLKLKEVTGKKIQPETFKHVRTVGDVTEAIHAELSSVVTDS
ncbi:MAG: Phosphopantetheine attachment site [Nevskia sp.]|jgi:acyl carrier protein|nr:Phosphopantetheine attachment site [Nevskia sp.]